MRVLDYFYKNYISPVMDGITEMSEAAVSSVLAVGVFILNVFLIALLVITLPVWIIPYKLKKAKEERSGDGGEIPQ